MFRFLECATEKAENLWRRLRCLMPVLFLWFCFKSLYTAYCIYNINNYVFFANLFLVWIHQTTVLGLINCLLTGKHVINRQSEPCVDKLLFHIWIYLIGSFVSWKNGCQTKLDLYILKLFSAAVFLMAQPPWKTNYCNTNNISFYDAISLDLDCRREANKNNRKL